jgi:hypothetical protein
LELRRRTFGADQFGSDQFGSGRFTTVAQLESSAHRPVAELGLTVRDRIRVEAGGAAVFLAWQPE